MANGAKKIGKTVDYKKQNKNDCWHLVEFKKHLLQKSRVKFGPKRFQTSFQEICNIYYIGLAEIGHELTLYIEAW